MSACGSATTRRPGLRRRGRHRHQRLPALQLSVAEAMDRATEQHQAAGHRRLRPRQLPALGVAVKFGAAKNAANVVDKMLHACGGTGTSATWSWSVPARRQGRLGHGPDQRGPAPVRRQGGPARLRRLDYWNQTSTAARSRTRSRSSTPTASASSPRSSGPGGAGVSPAPASTWRRSRHRASSPRPRYDLQGAPGRPDRHRARRRRRATDRRSLPRAGGRADRPRRAFGPPATPTPRCCVPAGPRWTGSIRT